MKSLFKSLWVAIAAVCFTFTLNAQDEWDKASTTGTTVNNTSDNMYRRGNVGIGTDNPLYRLHLNKPINTTNDAVEKIEFSNSTSSILAKGLEIESVPLLISRKGSQAGVWARTSSNYSSKIGEAKGILAHSKAFAGDGGFWGVYGGVSATKLTNSNNLYSRLVGGSFDVINTTNVDLVGTRFWVAGMKASLNGTINSTPKEGAVAAVIGIDNNQGTAKSWAGYFEGEGYFSENVGIGTKAPGEKLDVHGDVRIGGNNAENRLIFRGVYGDDQDWLGLHTVLAEYKYDSPESSELILFKGDNEFDRIRYDATGGHIFQVGGARRYNPAVHGTTAMTIANDGKVSIGENVSTPGSYKLYVKEGIMTEKVKIAIHNTAAWADYVFKEDYNMKSLEEVEQHIEKNGHLHNTPSAAQIVADGGIELKAITINQQEKIEELYLHLIELNKSHKELTAKYEALLEKVNQ